MKISVCSDMIMPNTPFSKALEKLSDDGVKTVEFWKWSNKDLTDAAELLNKYDMNICGFCADSADAELSAKIAVNLLNSDQKEDFGRVMEESVKKAEQLGAKFLIVTAGDLISGLDEEEQWKNIENNLLYVKDYLEKENIMLLVEPINRTERENYIAPYALPMIELIKRLGTQNIKLLYDVYHQTISGDDVLNDIIENIEYIGHIHIADVPGRNEPGTGKIDYAEIAKRLNEIGYDGYVGLEFVPTKEFSHILKDLKTLFCAE